MCLSSAATSGRRWFLRSRTSRITSSRTTSSRAKSVFFSAHTSRARTPCPVLMAGVVSPLLVALASWRPQADGAAGPGEQRRQPLAGRREPPAHPHRLVRRERHDRRCPPRHAPWLDCHQARGRPPLPWSVAPHPHSPLLLLHLRTHFRAVQTIFTITPQSKRGTSCCPRQTARRSS